MTIDESISLVHANYARIYLGGIPSTLNDNAAFLSFICMLTAIEALGGFLKPEDGNAARFKAFIKRYFSPQYHTHIDTLWELRNAAVHSFLPGPYQLTHHNGHLHMTNNGDYTILNAEDLYSALVAASERYFTELKKDNVLQTSFVKRIDETGVLAVGPHSRNN